MVVIAIMTTSLAVVFLVSVIVLALGAYCWHLVHTVVGKEVSLLQV